MDDSHWSPFDLRSEEGCDAIEIRGLREDCVIGVYPHERTRPQPLLLDLELRFSAHRAAALASLAATIDYARLRAELRFLLQNCHFHLIETAAEALCAYLLSPPTPDAPRARVSRAKVQLTKPSCMDGVASPRLTVERTAQQMVRREQAHALGRCEWIYATRDGRISRIHLPPDAAPPPLRHGGAEVWDLLLGDGLEVQGQLQRAGCAFCWGRGQCYQYGNRSRHPQTLLRVERPPFGAEDESSDVAILEPARQERHYYSSEILETLHLVT